MRDLIEHIQEKDIFKPASKEEASKRKEAAEAEMQKRWEKNPIKRFYFHVVISGIATDVNRAWEDALDQFSTDPGHPCDFNDIIAIKVDPEEYEEFGEEEKVAI